MQWTAVSWRSQLSHVSGVAGPMFGTAGGGRTLTHDDKALRPRMKPQASTYTMTIKQGGSPVVKTI